MLFFSNIQYFLKHKFYAIEGKLTTEKLFNKSNSSFTLFYQEKNGQVQTDPNLSIRDHSPAKQLWSRSHTATLVSSLPCHTCPLHGKQTGSLGKITLIFSDRLRGLCTGYVSQNSSMDARKSFKGHRGTVLSEYQS